MVNALKGQPTAAILRRLVTRSRIGPVLEALVRICADRAQIQPHHEGLTSEQWSRLAEELDLVAILASAPRVELAVDRAPTALELPTLEGPKALDSGAQ